MTDLELMKLLEEEGYEPNVENLISLKEGIERGEIEILDESELKNEDKNEYKSSRPRKTLLHRLKSKKETNGRLYPEDPHPARGIPARALQKGDSYVIPYDKEIDNDDSPSMLSHENKKRKTFVNRKPYDVAHLPEKRKELKESYSDYDLYQILDESGYKPTEKNLDILKEGLETGKYEIIDEGLFDYFSKENRLRRQVDKEANEKMSQRLADAMLKDDKKTIEGVALMRSIDAIPKKTYKKGMKIFKKEMKKRQTVANSADD